MTDSLDIQTLKQAYDSGRLDPADVLAEVLRRIERYPDPAVWIDRFPANLVEKQLAGALERRRAGVALPLLGIPFAIKDNIDFAGRPTTAACPEFAYVAEQPAAAVKRLCDAGAIAVGKTNLDQFATGLVGTRSPYGACRNPFNPEYISGGSSSGSAVAVAAGLVSFAIGTDTAGSGRVPAALNNIVGFKPTRGLLSTTGVVPACRSLDCVSILANSCDDAATIFRLLAGFDAADPYSRKPSELPARPPITPHSFTFGVPRDADLDFFGNAFAKAAFAQSVQRMRQIGGAPVEIDFAPFGRAAALLYAGPWVAERFLVARELLMAKPDALLPITRSILERGAHLTAAETFSAMYELQSLRQLAADNWERMDLLLIPTTGTAYTVDQIERNPIELNSNLGRYTNFVNLMDLCALAIPAGFGDENVPFGVSLVAPAGRDEDLLEIGDALHRSLGIGAGVGRIPLAPSTPRPRPIPPRAHLAVVGAHLSGMPLNHQLTDRRASLVRASKTAPCYRLYALPGTTPPKPGLIRVATGEGVSVELEIWEMSHEAFGSFVAAIPAPLGIGQILLEDGTSVQGFLCESVALTGARDISSFGGWRAFMKAT